MKYRNCKVLSNEKKAERRPDNSRYVVGKEKKKLCVVMSRLLAQS